MTTTTNTIKVAIKSVYGTDYIYPVCATAKKLTVLTGKKTLSTSAINVIKLLGYDVQITAPDIKL